MSRFSNGLNIYIDTEIDTMTLVNGLVSNDLSKEEVLNLFADYVDKFCNMYCNENTLTIPLGMNYKHYSEYIHDNLRLMFPNVYWTINEKNNYLVWTSNYHSKS